MDDSKIRDISLCTKRFTEDPLPFVNKLTQDIEILGWRPIVAVLPHGERLRLKKYWAGVILGKFYLMDRRCNLNLGWPHLRDGVAMNVPYEVNI